MGFIYHRVFPLIVVLTMLLLAEGAWVAAELETLIDLEQIVAGAFNTSPLLERSEAQVNSARMAWREAEYRAQTMKENQAVTWELGKLKYVQPRLMAAHLATAEANRDYSERLVRYRATRAYLEYHAALRQLEADREALETALEGVRVTAVAVEAGTASHYELLLAQSAQAQAGAVMAGAEAQVKIKQKAVNLEAGREIDAPLEVVYTSPLQFKQYDLHALRQRVLDTEPNLVQAREMVAAQEAAMGAAHSYLAPDMAQYEQIKADLFAAQEQYRLVSQQALLALETAYQNYDAVKASLEAHESTVAASQEVMRLVGLRFETGVGTIHDVLKAQEQLAQSKSRLVSDRVRMELLALQLDLLVLGQ